VNIGRAVVRWLLAESDAQVFNLDKIGYASDLTSIERVLQLPSEPAGEPCPNRNTSRCGLGLMAPLVPACTAAWFPLPSHQHR
jgi:hypothetical protein